MDLGSPGDWHYLAEGGANVVLSYRGPLVHLRGHALRLRKRQVRQGQLPSAPSPVPEIDPSVLLYDTVVSKLLPERAAALSQVPLRPGFLEEGTPEWHAARPNSRAAANDEIDCSKQTAVLAQNMVQSFSLDQEVQTVSFEIKPKWGFMPSPEFLSETTQQAKTNTCRYCRHSCFRRKMTSYCPMDLYSGDPSRVRNAISALFRDWVQSSGNTNNLRIFLNGHLLVPDDVQGLSYIKSLLQLDASEYDGFGDILSQNLHQPLQNQDVLPRLAHIQSALDPIDIEGLRHIIKDTTGVDLAASQADQAFLSQCHEANLGGEPTVQELEFLAKLLIESGPSPYVVRQLSVRHRIVAYLLSAAFKDCSLFVRLDFPNRLLSQPVISLKIVDVDLKSICRLPHYFALDQLLADPNMCLKACTGNDAAHIRAMPP